jgi:hypothetical protein
MAHQNRMIIWTRTIITSATGNKYSTYYMHREKAIKGVDGFEWCGGGTNIGHGKFLGDIAWVRKELLFTDTGE